MNIRDRLYRHNECVAMYAKYDLTNGALIHQIGDVGGGWLPIVEDLIVKLIDKGWDRALMQVKEKFGSLRFYIGTGTPEIFDLIREAENKSAVTCEDCGKPGRVARWGAYWLKCFCDEHGAEWADRFKEDE